VASIRKEIDIDVPPAQAWGAIRLHGQWWTRDASQCVVWIVDLLPNDIAGSIDALMNAGAAAMKATLEGATPSTSS
jgi:hypothetical protein